MDCPSTPVVEEPKLRVVQTCLPTSKVTIMMIDGDNNEDHGNNDDCDNNNDHGYNDDHGSIW